MCYNFETSLTTFIIGTIVTLFSFYKIENKIHRVLILSWYSPILMQFWETLIWKDYKCNLSTKFAFITNIIQPFMIPLMFLLLYPEYIIQNKEKFYLVGIILVIYLWSIKDYFTKNYGCIKSEEGIELKWWSDTGANNHFVAIILILLLLLKPKLAIFQIALFTISIVISFQLNNTKPLNNAGRIGSLWCWIASFIPIVNHLYFIIN